MKDHIRTDTLNKQRIGTETSSTSTIEKHSKKDHLKHENGLLIRDKKEEDPKSP